MKPKKQSAGILLYRIDQNRLEIFLVHPGGPFWAKKDGGAWSIPKGEFASDEDPLEAAKREFKEETGKQLSGDFIPLRPIVQKAGKEVFAWISNSIVSSGSGNRYMECSFLFIVYSKYPVENSRNSRGAINNSKMA